MNQLWIALVIFGLIFVAVNSRAQAGENVDVRAGINHESFDRLLKKYVNEQGLVNYGAWKQNAGISLRSTSISISSQQRSTRPRREMRRPLHW
jgi:hypothetical protein